VSFESLLTIKLLISYWLGRLGHIDICQVEISTLNLLVRLFLSKKCFQLGTCTCNCIVPVIQSRYAIIVMVIFQQF